MRLLTQQKAELRHDHWLQVQALKYQNNISQTIKAHVYTNTNVMFRNSQASVRTCVA